MSEERFRELWANVEHIGKIEHLSDDALLALGGIFGELKSKINKQAERVQELEELLIQEKYDKNLFNARTEEWIKMKQQNKRYREALEFYADENNYREQELKGIVPPRPITFKPILHDYGSIARQALEESK